MRNLMLKKNELKSTSGLELFGYIKCSNCNSHDFKYKEELSIAGNQFGLYECVKCSNALVLDRDKKFSAKKAIYSTVLEYKEQKRLI